MFGRNKASSAVKQKQRWFFKVENIADAEEAIKIGYLTFYALAAIQAVVLSALYFLSDVSALSLFDPILMLILAWFIHHKKSRTAAVMLGMYTVLIAISTLGNRMGVNLIGGVGGKNIVLAAFALYGMYKGLQGTFKYHRIRREQDPEYGRVRRWMYFVWVPIGLVGVLVAGLAIVGLTGPSLNVITGGELTQSDLEFLRTEGIVEPNEHIVLFFSAGLFSIREDGNLITDKRVISYEEIDNELWLQSARFDEIEDVSIEESGDFFSNTVLLVTLVDGVRFRLFVSTEKDGDKRFFDELKKRVK